MQPDAISLNVRVGPSCARWPGRCVLAALPASYALWLIAVVCTYGLAAHLVKKCYLRFVGSWM
jgi:hypothetical protein